MRSKMKTTATKEEATPALVPKLRFPEFREAAGWETTPLGELGAIVTGKTPSTKEDDLWGGEMLFITPTDITEGERYQHTTQRTVVETRGTKVLPPGSVVYTCIASIGKMALTVVPSVTNQQINAVVPNGNTAREFIYYSLANLTPWIKSIPATSTLPIINKTQFSGFIIPHPEDKAEQQKIAECLSSVDELMAAQARKVAVLKTHKKGLMQQLFPREGETQPRLRFPEFQNAGEWEVTELGSLSDVRDGTHDSPSFFQSGRPLVTSKNLRPDGTLDLENVSLISEEDYVQINKRSKVSVGDILFGMIGTIGNPVLIKSEGFAIKNVALIKEVGPLSNAFLVQLLQSGYVAAIFAVLNTGNSQKFVALGKIRGLPIPVPSLPEQERIADCLSSLDALITAETQKHGALKTHKKGLMQQLFPSPEEVKA